MNSVYVIYNRKNDKYYIGQTKDLLHRLDLHNQKTFSNSYTSRFDGNWEIVYAEKVEDTKQAIIREKQLKSYRGRQFVKEKIKSFLD